MSVIPRWVYDMDEAAKHPVASAVMAGVSGLVLAPLAFRFIAGESAAFSLVTGVVCAGVIVVGVYRGSVARLAEAGVPAPPQPRIAIVSVFDGLMVVVGLALAVTAAVVGSWGLLWSALWFLGLGLGLVGLRMLARRRSTARRARSDP